VALHRRHCLPSERREQPDGGLLDKLLFGVGVSDHRTLLLLMPSAQAGVGHPLAKATFSEKSFFQSVELLVRKIVGLGCLCFHAILIDRKGTINKTHWSYKTHKTLNPIRTYESAGCQGTHLPNSPAHGVLTQYCPHQTSPGKSDIFSPKAIISAARGNVPWKACIHHIPRTRHPLGATLMCRQFLTLLLLLFSIVTAHAADNYALLVGVTKSRAPSRVLLADCSRDEQASEHDDGQHGAFTVESAATDPPRGLRAGAVAEQMQVVTNSIDMKLVLIPAGEFLMGSPEGEKDREANEGPQHRVRISKPFYLGETEVTQEQFRAVMNTEPWKGKTFMQENGHNAASYISHDDATEFCRRLSQREGKTYRLPREAEWEYACRGGTTTRFHFGDDESRLGEYAWFDGNARDKDEKYAHAVRQKKPNPFGLYDMHGNVWEWCEDWHDGECYASSPDTDPTGPVSGSFRVFRGGAWSDGQYLVRCARRIGFPPGYRGLNVGFRLVLE
jgi:formylglycine-generating enzyme required for sulfatase activity